MSRAIDSTLREYTWADILDLVRKDIGTSDPSYHDIYYKGWILSAGVSNIHEHDICIVAQKYQEDSGTRLRKMTRRDDNS